MKTKIVPKPCVCGADVPNVGALKQKRPMLGAWYVACVKCGRVGRHAGSEKQATQNWNDNLIYLKGVNE